MNPLIPSALSSLRSLAQSSYVRYPVIVSGDDAFLVSVINTLPGITLISDTLIFESQMPWKKSKSLLGQEVGSLALDIRSDFDLENFCLISGCIKGGELLLLLISDEKQKEETRFRSRLRRFFNDSNASFICQSGSIHISSQRLPSSPPFFTQGSAFNTPDQNVAIQAIKRVLTGHRRRPVLLVSDRGRGKSCALGQAAGELLSSSSKRILVTSPVFAFVEILFKHALESAKLKRISKYEFHASNGSEIKFIAPDALLTETPVCDLLLVDEAASIPLPMLERILAQYSRLVFSSTEHGYEGSGRAFSVRFRALLEKNAPGWKEVKLETPVRWAKNDPLERWLFDVFLFDAKPIERNPPFSVCFHTLNKDQFLSNEVLLRDVFSLLVTAHYQTSPNDLKMLLDAPSQVLIGAFNGETLCGILIAQKEGGFDLETASSVMEGKKRVQGHLLPQSLASHTGVIDALTSTLFRVVRIAVLPEYRHRGIGRSLVHEIEKHARNNEIAFIGCSFGVTQKLWTFWFGLGYDPVRLGVKKDAASGAFSLQLIKELNKKAEWVDELRSLFRLNLSYQLCELFQEMDVFLAASLFTQTKKISPPNDIAMRQVRLFAEGALGYDFVLGSLYSWFIYWLSTTKEKEDKKRCNLLFARLLQKRAWNVLAKEFHFQGRKDTENAIRACVLFALKKSQF